MFSVCGVNHYENTHSAILVEFLNANGTHGLHAKLLQSFINILGERFTIDDFNSEESRIYREFATEEGRLDIIIIDNKGKAIIIENKVYANDQPEQLKRYDTYAKKHHKAGYQILYLTLNGVDASHQSSDGVTYLSISYKSEIIQWLEHSVAIAARFPIVRETIIQYINHLKLLTNQDMDTKNKEEITTLLSDIENLKIAKTIYENYPASFDHIVRKFFSPKMKEFAEKNGLEYHCEKSDEASINFHLTKPSWDGKYWIGFKYDGGKYYYGLCNKPENQVFSEENKIAFFKNMSNLIGESINCKANKSGWWPFYAYIKPLTLENWENDIVKSDVFLDSCKLKINQLLQAIKEMNF